VRRPRFLSSSVEQDSARICEVLVGLPDVNVLGVDDTCPVLEIHVECRTGRPGCPECGVRAHLKDQRVVTLVDLPCFGKCTRLIWHKRRWRCPDTDCTMGSWTEEDDRIAGSRLAMTDRAGRWITEQVGRCARSVNEVAKELGCDWHTVNDAVVAYGEALVDHPDRFDVVEALASKIRPAPDPAVSASA
jgi:transposase